MPEFLKPILAHKFEILQANQEPVLDLASCSKRLLELKSFQKELLLAKESETITYKEPLKQVYDSFRDSELWCSQQELLLKTQIIELYREAEFKRSEYLQQADLAYEVQDFASVHQRILQANECEINWPQGISLRQILDFTVVDYEAIPRDFLEINEKKIREELRFNKENTQIPGVKLIHRLSIAATA